MFTASFRKIASALLAFTLTAQPVFAASTEYRIPFRDLAVAGSVTPSSGGGGAGMGSGLGVVNTGDNPIPAKLAVAPTALQFDVTGGVLDQKSSVLTNTGAGPTAVSGITSSPEFAVSHTCPASLPAGASCIISVQPTTAAVDGSSYAMAIFAPTAAAPTMLQLSATKRTSTSTTQPPTPRLQLDPNVVNLGQLSPGDSATQSATVTNAGTASATLGGISSNDSAFVISSDCPTTLPAGASCTISATFSSTVPRSHTLSLPLTATAGGAPTPLTFYAWVNEDPAHMPALAFDIATLQFDHLNVGASQTKTATLSNLGTAAALLAPFKSTPNFTVTSNCPDTLQPNASCVVSVTFNALAPSTAPSLLLSALAQDNLHADIAMVGYVNGDSTTPPKASDSITFSPTSADFGVVPAGTTVSLPVTVSNAGTTDAGIKSVTVDIGAPTYSQVNDCGSTLAAGVTCTLTITFSPTAAATVPGTVTLAFADGSSTVLPLSGFGQKAVLSTGSLSVNVGTVLVPGTSKAVNVSAANNGNVQLTGFAISSNDSRLAFNYGNCTSTLDPKKGCTFSLVYTPATDGAISTSFQLVSDNGGTQTFTVTGLGVRMSVTPTSLTFPDTQIGTSAADLGATVSNDGQTNIPFDGISVIAGMQQFGQSNNCGSQLAAGSTCSIAVRYTPNKVGADSGQIALSSNGTPVGTLALAGTAIDYNPALSSRALSFKDTPYGQTSPPNSATLTNQAPDTLSITGISLSSGTTDFGQSNDCGATLAPGASCTITAQMTPSTIGVHNGTVSIVTSRGTYAISLSGSGIDYTLSMSAASLTFPSTAVNQSASPLSVIVTNPAPDATTITGISVASGASDFAQTNNCGTTLAGGASCTINVQMTPTQTGTRMGSVVLTTTSRGRYTVMLSGTAVAGAISGGDGVQPTSANDNYTHYAITFLDTAVGTSSAVRDVTFTNQGTASLSIQNIGVVNGLSDFNQSNNCAATLMPGQSCTIAIQFTPSALGARTGGVALLSDSGNFYFDLSGKGIGATGAWQATSTTAFGSVPVGASASLAQTFTNTSTLPIQNLSLSTTEQDLTLSSNSCGTASTPVTLAAGASCSVTVTYTPTANGTLTNAAVVAFGNMVPATVSQPLTGDSPASLLVFQSAPSGDFGTMGVGSSVTRTYTLQNTGKISDVLNSAPTVSGPAFTVTGGTCTTGHAMAPGDSCTVTVSVASSTAGTLNDQLKVTSKYGALAQLALTATYVLPTYALSGSAGSNTTAPADFGQVLTGNSVTQYYYLRDDSNIAKVAASSVSLSGDSSFSIVQLTVVSYSNTNVTACSVTATGTSTPCAAQATSQAIRVGVKFAPTATGAASASLHITHNGAGGSSDLQLTGTGAYAVGAWTTGSPTAQPVPPTSADLDYGSQTTTTNTDKMLVVENTAYGKLGLGFSLSGDTANFKITSVQALSATGSINSCGSTISTDGLSATQCTASAMPSSSTNYPFIRITVRFTPQTAGQHSVTLTPSSSNGTALPDVLTLTGNGLFDSTGAWSTTAVSTVAPTSANTTFSTISHGSTTSLTMYVRNVGNYGGESVGFVISGDTSQFRVSQTAIAGNSNSNVAACPTGGVISTDKLSATPCHAALVNSGSSAQPNVRISVAFWPTAAGTFNMTLTPTTDNGTVLPGAITFTGTAK